jgi:hypothetical protein
MEWRYFTISLLPERCCGYNRLIGAFQLDGILRLVGFASAAHAPSPEPSGAYGGAAYGLPPGPTHLTLQRVDAAVMYVTLDIINQQKQVILNI